MWLQDNRADVDTKLETQRLYLLSLLWLRWRSTQETVKRRMALAKMSPRPTKIHRVCLASKHFAVARNTKEKAHLAWVRTCLMFRNEKRAWNATRAALPIPRCPHEGPCVSMSLKEPQGGPNVADALLSPRTHQNPMRVFLCSFLICMPKKEAKVVASAIQRLDLPRNFCMYSKH
jgi:hypothetical protein